MEITRVTPDTFEKVIQHSLALYIEGPPPAVSRAYQIPLTVVESGDFSWIAAAGIEEGDFNILDFYLLPIETKREEALEAKKQLARLSLEIVELTERVIFPQIKISSVDRTSEESHDMLVRWQENNGGNGHILFSAEIETKPQT